MSLKERLHDNTIGTLNSNSAHVTGLQHVQCTDNVIMPAQLGVRLETAGSLSLRFRFLAALSVSTML